MFKRISALIMAVALAGCASAPPEEGQIVADPYENVNRNIHAFNKGLDRVVINPAAKTYDFVTPTTVQFLVSNGLDHLALPGYFANHLMQGEFKSAGSTLGRFVVNTIYGAGGLLDPATELGLPEKYTDFGLTLADWGAGEGAYIELPLFGPSTGRHAAGRVVDTVFNPAFWIGNAGHEAVAWGIRGTRIVDTRERYRPIIDETLYNSEDSYISARTAYIQNRRRLVTGETEVEDLPDVFSE